MVQKRPLKRQAELVILVWKSIAVSLLLAIVCIALSYFSVIFSQISESGLITWNCSGWAAVLFFRRSWAEQSPGAEGFSEQAAVAWEPAPRGSPPVPPAPERSAACWSCGRAGGGWEAAPLGNSNSMCQDCVGHHWQELLQEEHVLLPCTTSVWTSPKEPVLVGVRILDFSAFLLRFGGVFFLKRK